MGSLSDFVQSPLSYGLDTVPIEVRYQICLDVLEGLKCLHAEGIVHGDVKPANILIFKYQNQEVPFIAKISDFGMCVALEAETSMSYAHCQGTSAWAAPELVKYRENREDEPGEVVLSKSDVFSYGLLVLSVLYCSGDVPFEFDDYVEDSAIDSADHMLNDYMRSPNSNPDLALVVCSPRWVIS